MQLVAPDILAEARGLSATVSGTGLAIGLLLWLLGLWGHRFWLVLGTTLLAGIFGLYAAPAHGVQPMVAGLLLAVAAGVLALALVRLVAFAAGGIAVWLLVRAVAPAWDSPLVCVLAGGLVGLLLFRLWMMALTSTTGSLLMAYSGLCLADRLGKLDAVAWSEQHGPLLTWACLGVAFLGLIVQFLLERRRTRRRPDQDEFEDQRGPGRNRYARKRGWLGQSRSYRQAG